MKTGIPLKQKDNNRCAGKVRFGCPVCSQHLRISRARVGEKTCCPGCMSIIIVPEPEHQPVGATRS